MSPQHIASKYLMVAVISVFIIALVIHGHQTEATYRLDFLWKLQATGTVLQFMINFHVNLCFTVTTPKLIDKKIDKYLIFCYAVVSSP